MSPSVLFNSPDMELFSKMNVKETADYVPLDLMREVTTDYINLNEAIRNESPVE